MLTSVEKMLFTLLALFALGATYNSFLQMGQVINRGQGKLYLDHLPSRIWNALVIYLTQRTTLKARRLTSLFHLGVVLGFTYYFLVNVIDGLEGFFPGFHFLQDAPVLNDLYRLVGDVLSVAVLVGVVYFILRRFVLPAKKDLTYHDNVLLQPAVKDGAITRDSLIVAIFILIHVGSRFLGQSVAVAATGADLSRPFATAVSPIWGGVPPDGLLMLQHLFWWVALGAILLFMPYFPYS